MVAAALAEEAVAMLRVLHEVGVLHRDPTPRNVLLCGGSAWEER
jgi:tRNA A-37 threonylcarbamoyl transferase component Bud32